MNSSLLTYLITLSGFVIAVFLFALYAPYKWKLWLYRNTIWLIEVAYLFFVDIVIFLKPLKKHREKVGFYLWLFLVVLIVNFLITKQSQTTEINPAYLFFSGYVFVISALYIIKMILELVGKTKRDVKE